MSYKSPDSHWQTGPITLCYWKFPNPLHCDLMDLMDFFLRLFQVCKVSHLDGLVVGLFKKAKINTGFIQASLSKSKDLSRTVKTILVFNDYKFMKNPDLSVKILHEKC